MKAFIFCLSIIVCSCTYISPDAHSVNETLGRKVILEVISENSNTVYPPGKTLDIRVFIDGRAEFDFYPPDATGNFGPAFKTERKESSLAPEDFERLKTLLFQLTAVPLNDQYPPTRPGLDATVQKTIGFDVANTDRTVIVQENDSHLHLSEKATVYPSGLYQLLELTIELNKNLRKEIDARSR